MLRAKINALKDCTACYEFIQVTLEIELCMCSYCVIQMEIPEHERERKRHVNNNEGPNEMENKKYKDEHDKNEIIYSATTKW